MAVFRNALLLVTALLPASPTQAQDRRLTPVQSPTGAPQRRVALVIGNDAYPTAPLKNALNDARGLAAALTEVGFTVQREENLNFEKLARAIDGFMKGLRPNDVALFFYAGHGIQVDGENYLIPVDFTASDELSAKYRGYAVDQVRERMERASTALSMIVLDACRNNPFGGRTLGGGLAAMQGGRGTLIAFATGPWKTASDNPTGGNGLFTTHLLEALRTPGLSLTEVFDTVRERVDAASQGKQVPWTSSSVVGRFYFRPPTTAPGNSSTSSPSVSAPSTTVPERPSVPADGGPLALRWAYATVPTDQTTKAATLQNAQRVAQRFRLGLLLGASESGLVWASPRLDLSARLNAPSSTGTVADVPMLTRLAFVDVSALAQQSALGRRYSAQINQVTKDKQTRIEELRRAGETDARLKTETEAAQKALSDLQSDLQAKFTATLVPVLAHAASDGRLDLIFSVADSGATYVHSTIDITPSIVQRLDQATGEGGSSAAITVPILRRTAFINLQAVASESVAGKNASAEIKALTDLRTKDIAAKNSDLLAAQQKLQSAGSAMNDTVRRQLERDIDRLKTDVTRLQEDAQREVNDLQTDLQEKFQKVVVPAIEQLAKDNDIQVVLSQADSGIIASDPSLDITTLVTRRLDAATPKK